MPATIKYFPTPAQNVSIGEFTLRKDAKGVALCFRAGHGTGGTFDVVLGQLAGQSAQGALQAPYLEDPDLGSASAIKGEIVARPINGVGVPIFASPAGNGSLAIDGNGSAAIKVSPQGQGGTFYYDLVTGNSTTLSAPIEHFEEWELVLIDGDRERVIKQFP